MMRRTVLGMLLGVAAAVPARAQEIPIGLSGEVRLRYEAERTAQIDTLDGFALLRSRLGLQAELVRDARVFLQIQDARTFGEEASTADGSADRLDLHQAWLELVRPVGSLQLGIRAGRQEIGLGSERLIGAVGWSNTGRAFDAARLTLRRPESTWQVTGFAATLRERGRRAVGVNTTERSDQLLLGLYGETRVLDGWLLFDRADSVRTFREIDRVTVGGRIDAPTAGALTAWVEGAYQLGNQVAGTELAPEDQDIAAYLVGGRVAYAPNAARLASLGVGVDYLSGDETPLDGEYGAFNTLYHTGHKWYGYLDLFLDPASRTGDRGLIDGIASLTLNATRAVPITLDVHRFWTAVQRADEANDLGWELDVTVPVTLAAGQKLQLGYSAFRNGSAAPVIGLGEAKEWAHWAYLMATFSFDTKVRPTT